MPLSQVRRTEHLKTTGNFFKDSVDNTVEVLRRFQRGDINDPDPDMKLTYITKVTDVYDHDVYKIPKTPAIAVSWESYDEKIRSLGMQSVTAQIDNKLTIFYYHAELSVNIRKHEIRDALWEIARILRRNADLNGLSSQGTTVGNGQMLNRIRNGIPYAGGQLSLMVPILTKTRRGVS